MMSEMEIDDLICTGRIQRPDSGKHKPDLNHRNGDIVLQPVPRNGQFIDLESLV